MENILVYWCYIWKMEKRMEATIFGLWFGAEVETVTSKSLPTAHIVSSFSSRMTLGNVGDRIIPSRGF